MQHRKNLKDEKYEDTTTGVVEGEVRVSGQDDSGGGAGIAGGPSAGLPEVWWAPISALVVMQSDFGSSLVLYWHRLAGTALGAFVGALLAAHFGRSVIALGLGVFGIGVLSATLRLQRPANRFAAIAQQTGHDKILV